MWSSTLAVEISSDRLCFTEKADNGKLVPANPSSADMTAGVVRASHTARTELLNIIKIISGDLSQNTLSPVYHDIQVNIVCAQSWRVWRARNVFSGSSCAALVASPVAHPALPPVLPPVSRHITQRHRTSITDCRAAQTRPAVLNRNSCESAVTLGESMPTEASKGLRQPGGLGPPNDPVLFTSSTRARPRLETARSHLEAGDVTCVAVGGSV
ncbi:hypothetical protein EVAR_47078_1 [Eumeta japonica]|uniref:Uncharacterized protein n=1 Tax=Eumeta variegata TaxID=151549 RepID=A0A4C1WKW7_EUMVA|nr:hypothetical protein EVAR_47078_1 [Eumeta japonica]